LAFRLFECDASRNCRPIALLTDGRTEKWLVEVARAMVPVFISSRFSVSEAYILLGGPQGAVRESLRGTVAPLRERPVGARNRKNRLSIVLGYGG
jgi:hypothetical protein